ncbi:MAG TPA: glutamate--cysteine ligase, partial [Rhizobiales bacterium]|nr:glutamate--cysteine ligase [Hyphomicrobiales bacterium]
TLDEIPVMPKGRYKIMREYMAKKGKLGRDMMFRSCTVQVNLDFSSEADMVKKLRAGMSLQPVVTALFANSPLTEGKPNGYQSYRSHIWTDTDPDRTGILPFVFEDGFGFERWVDYALDVPMYFVYRDGVYHDVSGESFRDYLDGKLPQFPGEKPTVTDWENHLTTIFPEARIKQYMEMRGADAGPWRTLVALPALWTGLLYDEGCLDAARQIARGWSVEDIARLREEVPVKAFDARIGGRNACEVARDLLQIARKGLERRHIPGCKGFLETQFLSILEEIVENRQTQASLILDLYNGRWKHDASQVFRDFAF